MLKLNKEFKIALSYVTALIGFIMLLLNTLAFFFHFANPVPAMTIIGILFITIGILNVKKLKNQ